ncbi:monooxygenase [Streptomyces sp. AJS327]|uniref:FAD-dependent monooxygenase n=1 Tax=Streptomyces sp. AJS327 TaxID=2545265 RepID=UPI0015DEC49A|nr:FAD-dependent monooxygenase [Streptomyces sp. AJS327]MBA0051236.1 monooxygenase [Streptomyces sp. AJS327]
MSAVAVVGAGPVGLAAALAAHSLGLDTTLLEARPRTSPRAGSRAIFVHRATLALLDGISPGLGGRIAGQGLVWDTKRTLWAGRQVHSRTYDVRPGRPAPFVSLPQTAVEDELRRACDAAGITSVWGDAVSELRGDPGGVRLVTESGREHPAGHVIAADGARSRVRDRSGIHLEGAASDNEFVVVDVADGPRPARPERVFHYRHPGADGRNVLLVPFRGGWRVDVQCRPGDDAADLRASASRWLPAVFPHDPDARISWSSVYRFQRRLASSFTDTHRRVLLAGEAAHLLPPFGARGMNSGIQDAVAAAHAVREDTVAEYARTRRAAAEVNARAAGQALDHLLAARWGRRCLQWSAAGASLLWPYAGKWLDTAPYGPRLRAARY